MTMNEIRKSMKKFAEELDTFNRFEELYKNGKISSYDEHFGEIVHAYHAEIYTYGGTIYATKKIVREILTSFISFLEEITADETSSSSDEIEKDLINSATTLCVYSEKGVAVKGYTDRIEVSLNFNTIPLFNAFFFSHDLGYIRYGDKKWTFSANEKNLTAELLHKLIELYDDDFTTAVIWLNGKLFTPIEFIDFLYMKERYNIFMHFCTLEKGFYHIYHGYVYKRLLIDTNKSNVFNKWKYLAPISKTDFLDGVKWICSDPSSDEENYTKSIALTPGGIIKLTAVHSASGYIYFDENGKTFSGAYFKRKAVTDKEKLFADEKGEISSFCKIILSPKDRI